MFETAPTSIVRSLTQPGPSTALNDWKRLPVESPSALTGPVERRKDSIDGMGYR
jgi:hypothetical protein